jgi:hypothetical protein
MVSAGDIVTVNRRDGTWVIHSRASTAEHTWPWAPLWTVIRVDREPHERLVAGDGDIEVVASPTFAPDMQIKFQGAPAVVVEDRGEHVRVRYDRRRQTRGGEFIHWPNLESDVSRAALTIENLRALLNEDQQ